MTDLEYLKQFHEIKEVEDIICDIEKLDSLENQNDWCAVEKHLQDVSKKHVIEKVLYSAVAQIPPQSTQQSAANCRQFLLLLGMKKVIEKLSNSHGGN